MKTYADHKISFRSKVDGRCMFGALRHKNATWERETLVYTGSHDISQKGYMLDIEGMKKLGAWKDGSTCDSLVGLQEPSVFPPIQSDIEDKEHLHNTSINETEESEFDIFVGIMCRAIPLKKVSNPDYQVNKFTKHIKPIRYEPASYVFDRNSVQESCYYDTVDKDNLPRGILGIQSCQQGTPFAVSFPHFLHGDNWYILIS